jgi:hypothetical protein
MLNECVTRAVSVATHIDAVRVPGLLSAADMEAFTLEARRNRGLRGGEAAAAMARGIEAAARILSASKEARFPEPR